MSKTKQEVQPADEQDIDIVQGEADPVVEQVEKERATNAMLMERLSQMEKRMMRAEFAGGNKNKQRHWDSIHRKDENIKFGFLPSFDGVKPIVDWVSDPKGVSREVNGQLIDTQSWICTVRGEDQKVRIDLSEVNSRISGNGIYVRINNWKAFRRNVDEIDELKGDYQRAVGDMSAEELKELRERIDELTKNLTVNVTLSEDRGKTYTGETFDVLAKMINASR